MPWEIFNYDKQKSIIWCGLALRCVISCATRTADWAWLGVFPEHFAPLCTFTSSYSCVCYTQDTFVGWLNHDSASAPTLTQTVQPTSNNITANIMSLPQWQLSVHYNQIISGSLLFYLTFYTFLFRWFSCLVSLCLVLSFSDSDVFYLMQILTCQQSWCRKLCKY